MTGTISRRAILAGAAALPALALAGCAGTVTKPGDLSRLRMMAPAGTGGGWDTTARTLQRVIRSTGIARNVQVFNVEGAGGTIGLGQLSREDDDALLMVMGLVMVGAVDTNESPVRVTDVTAIARLTGEQEVLVVPGDSEHADLASFIEAWKADPRKFPVAGGSAGGTDQILAGLVGVAGGVDPKQINYIAYSGGGESLSALLGGQVALGISGIGEYAPQVTAGKLKALAVSGEKRSSQLPDVPTLTEAGIDVVVLNWRGLMARPGMSAVAQQDLIDLVVRAHDTPEWKEALANNDWEDLLLTGADYQKFLEDEDKRVHQVLQDIGLVTS